MKFLITVSALTGALGDPASMIPRNGRGFGMYAKVGSRSTEMFMAVNFKTSVSSVFDEDQRNRFFPPLEGSSSQRALLRTAPLAMDRISISNVTTHKVPIQVEPPTMHLPMEGARSEVLYRPIALDSA
jgi:hypothetical protein